MSYSQWVLHLLLEDVVIKVGLSTKAVEIFCTIWRSFAKPLANKSIGNIP